MIVLPKRSVTRFFIPLIDVLILLFAIFMMLPIVDDEALKKKMSPEAMTADDIRRIRTALGKAQENLADLKKGKPTPKEVTEKIKELENLLREKLSDLVQPVILDIHPTSGQLSHTNIRNKVTVRINNAEDARNFIEKRRDEASQSDIKTPLPVKRKLRFIIKYPPADLRSSHPTIAEREKYDRWFREVDHEFR